MQQPKVINFDDYPLFTYGCLTNFNSDKYYLSTKLGQIDAALPWQKLTSYFERKFRQSKQKSGRPRVFSIRTELALIIVKAVTGLSDAQILERLAQDWVFQRFCKVSILEKYQNTGIISDIRERYAKVANLQELQRLFAEHWQDYLSLVEGVLMDATVFKSNIRYPNEVELLWDAIKWLHKRIKLFSKLAAVPMLKSKYREVEKAYRKVMIQKEPRLRQVRKVIRRELNLLSKYINHFQYLLNKIGGEKVLYPSETEVYQTILKVYQQRKAKFEGKRVKGLILSLTKPYVRSIYRGKRSSKWEYGQKYHLYMLGKMAWIDKVWNENFNEAKRLEAVVIEAESYVGHRLKYLSADRIYGTRSNRQYLKRKGIKENFVPVGRPIQNPEYRKQQKLLKRELNRARNSIMEGVFGVLKEHYYTERVRLKRQQVEVLHIFLALMSYNAKVYTRWKLNQKEILYKSVI